MAVLMVAMGSRGDVAPMVVLARALVARGEQVGIVALDDYADLVVASGAQHVPVGATMSSVDQLADSHVARLALDNRSGLGQLFQPVLLRRWLSRIAPNVARAVLEAARDGDALLTGVATRDVATALAQARGCRVATVLFTGNAPTVHRDSFFNGDKFGPSARLNRWVARYPWAVQSDLGRPIAELVRRHLGLPVPDRRGVTAAADRHPILVAQSPLLVPPAPDWPPTLVQTGALVDDATNGWIPPDDLRRFLDDGPRPVYAGFGSNANAFGERAGLLTEGAARAGCRLILPAWIGRPPGRVAEHAFTIGVVPHAWLFPRMAGIVHHGGAGTTVTALRSGRPSVVVPFMFDQPYHARRTHTLGAGPRPVRARRLTVRRFAALLDELTSGRFDSRAAAVGAEIRAEDGVAATVAAMERLGLISA